MAGTKDVGAAVDLQGDQRSEGAGLPVSRSPVSRSFAQVSLVHTESRPGACPEEDQSAEQKGSLPEVALV